MRDEQLASLPSWASVAELVSGILFIAAIVGDTNQSVWSWVGIGLGLFLIVHAARSTRMELRVIGAHLRIVNTYRSVDILLANIEDVIPEPDRPGPLQERARGLNRPVRIDVSPRNRQERERGCAGRLSTRCARPESGALQFAQRIWRPWTLGAMRATDQWEGGAA